MRILLLTALLAFVMCAGAQPPPGYYDNAQGLAGEDLQEALHNIIKNHNSISYSELWNAFEDTDKKSNGKVWDIYSDVPGGNPPYQFTFFSDQCGNYGQEGDCYNREHSFPRSWFGGTVPPMNTDLFHIYPTDGYVNGKRNNFPYGDVGNVTWTSQNGSRLGSCSTPGYSGTVFEPIDEYKGDLARTYFYMATRYLNEDNNWPGSPMMDGAQPKEWALTMLFDWHTDDPVSQKEMGRNNAVYDYQSNRNPFVDFPEFVEDIWFNTTIDHELLLNNLQYSVYPNPARNTLHIERSAVVTNQKVEYKIADQTGREIISTMADGSNITQINIAEMESGFYFLIIHDLTNHLITTRKIIKQ
jgi:endonuclease I